MVPPSRSADGAESMAAMKDFRLGPTTTGTRFERELGQSLQELE